MNQIKINEKLRSKWTSYTTRTATRGFRHGHRSSPFDPLVLHVRLDALADLTRLVIRLWPMGIFKEPLLLRNDTQIRKPEETFICRSRLLQWRTNATWHRESLGICFIRFSFFRKAKRRGSPQEGEKTEQIGEKLVSTFVKR
jgi:hypothetical protein